MSNDHVGLSRETSPYLLQHATNPVDWYPWGPEALEKAQKENRPIFLSIGYSSCHWCHVMERESFDNLEIAELLKSLNMEPRELLRPSEAEYKELGLKNQDFSNEQLIQIMSENPKLIEGPIVTNNSIAVIGRPPENVLKLIG